MALVPWARSSSAAANHLRTALFAQSSCQRAGFQSLIADSPESYKWIVKRNVFKSLDKKEAMIVSERPFRIQEHGFARVAAPEHLQPQRSMRLYQDGVGMIIEPYREQPFPPLKRWFTKEGWKEIKEYFLDKAKSAFVIAKLKQKRGYKIANFKREVAQLYTQINMAIAEGNRNALRPRVTDKMLSILKKELKQREGVWAKLKWSWVGQIEVGMLQGRAAATSLKDSDNAYIQMTFRIKSRQIFGAFDQNSNLVAGNLSEPVLVEDIWVFETRLGSPDKSWRLCGRISL